MYITIVLKVVRSRYLGYFGVGLSQIGQVLIHTWYSTLAADTHNLAPNLTNAVCTTDVTLLFTLWQFMGYLGFHLFLKLKVCSATCLLYHFFLLKCTIKQMPCPSYMVFYCLPLQLSCCSRDWVGKSKSAVTVQGQPHFRCYSLLRKWTSTRIKSAIKLYHLSW